MRIETILKFLYGLGLVYGGIYDYTGKKRGGN